MRITRAGWEEALSLGVLTTAEPRTYASYAAWEEQFQEAQVHIQWDPERSLRGVSQPHSSFQVGLSRQAELPCRYLSAGQRRRLGLARLLASNRPLWLLDEPFAALDSAGKALVARLIALHCGQGGMVMAATHEPLGLSNRSLKL